MSNPSTKAVDCSLLSGIATEATALRAEHADRKIAWTYEDWLALEVASLRRKLAAKQPPEPSEKPKYPQIVKTFEIISSDNGGCSADEIEEALRSLDDADLETLAAGEYFDQEAVKAKLREQFDAHTIEALDDLLEVAFQGSCAEQPPEQPFTTRTYIISEPHHGGFRLIVGFDSAADVDAAHEYVGNSPKQPPTKEAGPVWKRDNEVTADLLGLVEVEIPVSEIATWTDEQVRHAEDWAGALHLGASDNDDVEVPPRPSCIDEYLSQNGSADRG